MAENISFRKKNKQENESINGVKKNQVDDLVLMRRKFQPLLRQIHFSLARYLYLFSLGFALYNIAREGKMMANQSTTA
jgi:hypothetical protein